MLSTKDNRSQVSPLLIVVPTLNSYPLLPRLLGSLQQQTWPHWQLLFIDGPSSPQHRQWLDQCCMADSRCRWVIQDSADSGIFGAMNQGFAQAAPDQWLMFWGSDDWAPEPYVLKNVFGVLTQEEFLNKPPDLLVCRGRYVDVASGSLTRNSVFHDHCLLTAKSFRRALLLGSTPPHQATLIGPSAQQYLSSYSPGFRLSADLDYFLRLSTHLGLRVQCLDLELVHMADSGVSSQQTHRRLYEVFRAYTRAFGWFSFFPFIARYLRRIGTLFNQN